ncbi:tape measure protein [Acinetobacter venetianus]|uniref:tape measure protein n=1 Tax=Acinetobacter venetianus TaxID=52133 RepID=UPI00241F6348|nr:tape measure protein [Acinetobacter venetianus]
MSKDLVFKVVMQGDTNNFDSSVKKSKQTAEQMFQAIGTAVEELEKKTKKSSDSTKNIVSTEAQDRVKDLTAELNAATNVIVALGDKSTISAKEIRTMSQQSQQAISSLKDELAAAQSQYLQLSQAKASPQDIGEAISKITDIKRAIRDVETAFGAYQTVAANAMTGVTKATSITINEIQKFTSVDLNVVISEAQTATRAIESMGDGAVVSTKEVQRISQLGSTAIESLTRELNSAKKAWVDLSNSKGVDLEELTAAKERVQGLERALNLTETSMTEFKGATQQAIPIIDHLDQTLDSTNQELKETESLSQKVSGELAGLKTGFNAVTGALAALGIGATAQEIAKTADEWSNLNARVKIAVGTHGDAKAAMADVIEIARTTNSNLTATGDLYARLTKIGQEMKIPQEQVLQLTKTISQAIQVSGGSAASAEAAITQFQQALASGVLRGDEFNSMMEQSPRLMQALAEGLGVTTGELRKMAGEGKLTTDVVTKAMLSQSAVIQKEFEQFPTTIGSSIENLKTSWTVFIGELDQTHGVSTKVAESLKWVAENLDAIFNTLKLATQAFIVYKALNIAGVFLDKAAGVRAASIAITQETASVVANTQAQLLNAAATNAVSTAKNGLATAASNSSKAVAASNIATTNTLGALIGRLGALGVAVTAVGVIAYTVLEPIGTWAGEGIAKLGEYGDAIEKLDQQMALDAARSKVVAESKREIADAAEKGAIKTYELSKASQDLVNKFNQLVKDGKPTAEALKEVRESMKFDSLTGINNAVSALNMLERTGKITAQELRAELKSALVNEDLVVFQTNAKAAFAGTAQEANKMAQVTQVAMELAVERTGMSFEQLQGKGSAASRSLVNDILIIVDSMDELKRQGVDVGLALNASISKAIDGAETEQQVGAISKQIQKLRGELGQKVADGLLQQAEQKLIDIQKEADKTKSGINSVAEAFGKFGIQTKAEAALSAKSYMDAFGEMEKSGQATTGQLRQALMKMTDDIYNSGDATKIAWYESKLASYDLKSSIDDLGKASVKTMNDVANSARNDAGQGFRDLGKIARDEAKSTAQEWEDAMAKVDAARKAKDASNNKGLSELQGGIDQMAQDYYDRLVAAGMDQSRARDLADKARYSLAVETTTSLKGGTTQNMNTTKQEMEKTLAYWENRNSNKSGSGSVSTGNNSPSIQVPSIQAPTIESPKMPKIDTTPDKNVRIELTLGGTSTELFGTQDQVDAAQELFRQLEEAKKRS